MNRRRAAVLLVSWIPFTAQPAAGQAREPAADIAPICQAAPGGRQPVIDVHLHTLAVERIRRLRAARGLDAALPMPASDADLLEVVLAELDRYNVVAAVVSGPLPEVFRWTARAPDRLIGSVAFSDTTMSIDSLRTLYGTGRLRAMGELGFQYEGFRPDDPSLDRYFALAEELDLPVGIHMYGGGAPGAPRFRMALGDPLLLEEVLIRYPRLRLYIMHAGLPFLEGTTAIMRRYPQVYADLSQINFAYPREQFHSYLLGLLRAGLAKQLMHGSDPVRGPHVIALGLDGITSAAFLSDEQRRDILCGNAARFFRLDAPVEPR